MRKNQGFIGCPTQKMIAFTLDYVVNVLPKVTKNIRELVTCTMNITKMCDHLLGASQALSGKESACQCRRCSLIPRSGISAARGNENPLQYSCLENPVDRGDWQATVHGITQSWTRLSTHAKVLRVYMQNTT